MESLFCFKLCKIGKYSIVVDFNNSDVNYNSNSFFIPLFKDKTILDGVKNSNLPYCTISCLISGI